MGADMGGDMGGGTTRTMFTGLCVKYHLWQQECVVCHLTCVWCLLLATVRLHYVNV